jgi:hypothetical protein
MARGCEHFFMCFLAICISSVEKLLLSSVVHFLIGSLILGEFSFLSSLYILVISPLSDDRMENPDMNPHNYTHLTFDKGAKDI